MIELQFLNALLDTQDKSLLVLNNIDESFFTSYKNEYNFIRNHMDTYQNIPDKQTFADHFPNFDFIQVNENPNYLIDRLYEEKNKEALARTFTKVRDLVNANRTEEAINLYTSAAADMVKAKHLDCIDLLRDTTRYNDYLERCNNYNTFYVKTGFAELDELIGGWDRNEELVTIAARTNTGKTWVALRCAVAALEQGLNVGIYSGEMSDRKVGYRIDTLISHISNSGITRGNEAYKAQYKMYIDDLAQRYQGSLKVLTPVMLGGPAGVTALRAFIEKENLDILIVDQHSLLEDDRHAKTPVEKASNISKDLKNLQVLKKIPIIAVSQQNRSSTENGVDASHIAQSDRIGQDSTIILFFEKNDDSTMTLSLVKSRDSVNFKKFNYAVDFDKGIWRYLPDENDNGTPTDREKCEQIRNEFDNPQPMGVDGVF